MLEIGSIFEDKYRLIRSLGSGGFAGAFLAEDIRSNSKVVIKIPDLSKLGDPAIYERFRREKWLSASCWTTPICHPPWSFLREARPIW